MINFIKRILNKSDFIKFQTVEYVLKDDLKIDVITDNRIINKNDISFIMYEKDNRMFAISDKNASGAYRGFILDNKGKQLKTIDDIYKHIK